MKPLSCVAALAIILAGCNADPVATHTDRNTSQPWLGAIGAAQENLLSNGDFETGSNDWLSCGGELAEVTGADGTAGIRLSEQGCLYQEFTLSAGESFTLSCQGRSVNGYSSLTLEASNGAFEALESDEAQVSSAAYQVATVSLTAPAQAVRGVVTLYADTTADFDNCAVSHGIITPEEPIAPPENSGNLLNNGSFETGMSFWTNCNSAGNVDTSAASARLSNGGCLYQEFPVVVGETYGFRCDGKSEISYSSLELVMSDTSYQPLVSSGEQVVDGGTYSQFEVAVAAPTGTAQGVAVLYAETDAEFDRCEVYAGALVSPPPVDSGTEQEQLANGGFEDGLANWNACGGNPSISQQGAGNSSAASLDAGGCLYQEFPVTPGAEYSMSCAGSSSVGYSSLSFSMSDASYAGLESTNKVVDSNQLQEYNIALTAPPFAEYGVVTLYADSAATFDDCVINVESTDEPVSIAIVNPSFESTALGDGDIGYSIQGWAGASGVFNPSSYWYSSIAGNTAIGTMSGNNSAFFYGTDHQPLQQTVDTVVADTTYSLTAAIGGRSRNDVFAGVVIELFANGQVVAAKSVVSPPATGSFGDVSLEWTAPPELNGAALDISFRPLAPGDNRYVDIDNVRLVASVGITPPAVTNFFSADCSAKHNEPGSDVVLLMGQSNMSGYGQGYNSAIDGPNNPRIRQWTRANTITTASEHLEHADHQAGSTGVGMGTAFGRAYLNTLPSDRNVLLVPVAYGGTGLVNGLWSPGGSLFEDAISRMQMALGSDSGNCVGAILWHQGEDDTYRNVSQSNYRSTFIYMISTLRNRIPRAEQAPVILGEYTPAWIASIGAERAAPILDAINSIPANVAYTAVASSASITTANSGDIIHFDAAAMRKYGQLYFDMLNVAMNNDGRTEGGSTIEQFSGKTVSIAGYASDKCVDISGASLSVGANVVQYTCDGSDNQAFDVEKFGDLYRFRVRHSGQCLNISGASTVARARLIQWPCVGAANELWSIVDAGEGTYTLRPNHSRMCMNVDGASLSDNAMLVQWHCAADAFAQPNNQRWALDVVDNRD